MNAAAEIRSIWRSISDIKSRLTAVGGSVVTTHNSLAGLQGGAGGNYYHLNIVDLTGLADNDFLRYDLASTSWKPEALGGAVIGPGASTDHAVVRWNGAGGNTVQNSNLILDDTGLLLLNDTANTFMTIGLTLQQGAADNEILALKSSDVAHGITTRTETDTYGFFKKQAAGDGGLIVSGLSSDTYGLYLQSYYTNSQTTWTTPAALTLGVFAKSGADVGNANANQVLVAVRTYYGGGYTNVWGVNPQGQTWQPGTVWVNETVNTFMTIGLTINQGAADNEILALKSSDVAHGITTWAETDTYGSFSKIHATNGGFNLAGYTAGSIAIRFLGRVTSNNTTRGTAGLGIYHYYGSKKTGTTEGNVDAGANILSIACFTGGALPTVWLVDNTGATWQSGTAWVNEVSNANMTKGITVNQDGADDEILALKSSDVTHGCSDYAETDTFGHFMKVNAANGGMYVDGFGAGAVGLSPRGFGAVDNTAKTTAALAFFQAIGYKISGTGITNSTADQNIFAVRTQRGGALETVMMVDEDGDIYYDGALQNYDEYDDALAVRDTQRILTGRLDEFIKYNENDLVRLGILGDSLANGGLVSHKRLTALVLGAIVQLDEKVNDLKRSH